MKSSQKSDFEKSGWNIDTIKVNNLKLIRGKSELETKGLMTIDGKIIFAGDNYVSCQYFDINNDGYDDIRVYRLEEDSTKCLSLFFDFKRKEFTLISNVTKPFDLLQNDTYYTYASLGCDEWIWESILINIENYKGQKLAKIYSDQCKGKEEGILTYKYQDEKEILDTILPYSDKAIQDFNNRFEFIKYYWNKKYGYGL